MFRELPKLCSLKFLSLRGWDASDYFQLGKHPCIETVEISEAGENTRSIYQFLVPRETFNLSALTCSAGDPLILRAAPSALCRLEKLHLQDPITKDDAKLLRCSDCLVHLELSNNLPLNPWECFPPPYILDSLPPTLKYLKFENSSYPSFFIYAFFPSDPFDSSRVRMVCQGIRSLPYSPHSHFLGKRNETLRMG